MIDWSGVWLVVPAYNEGQVIGEVLARLAALPAQLVVVDDGSADDTGAQALRHPATVLRHSLNLGQGAALQTGISYALRQPGVRRVVTFDSDGQHRAEDVARLLAALDDGRYDVALGSRFLRPGDAVDIPPRRRLTLRLALAFTRLTTGLALSDTHNGLRAFTAAAAGAISITQNRMAHASEILGQIAALRLRYCEVPVTIAYTPYASVKGQTMLNSINIVWELVRGKLR